MYETKLIDCGEWQAVLQTKPQRRGLLLLVLFLALFSHLKGERRWLTSRASHVVIRPILWAQRDSAGFEGRYKCAHHLQIGSMVLSVCFIQCLLQYCSYNPVWKDKVTFETRTPRCTAFPQSPVPTAGPSSGWGLLGQDLESAPVSSRSFGQVLQGRLSADFLLQGLAGKPWCPSCGLRAVP